MIISFLYCRRIKNSKNKIEEKFKEISFTSGLEEDFSNKSVSEKSNGDDENENAFV